MSQIKTPALPFLIFVGRPCAGKSKIASELTSRYPHVHSTRSITTRDPRGDELPDEYKFVTEDDFLAMLARGEFAWTAQPYGPGTPWYGTTRDDVLRAMQEGNQIAILAGDGPQIAYALAQEQNLLANVCFIYFETGDGQHDQVLLERAGASQNRNYALVQTQLEASCSWDALARASDIPYHFVDALQTLETVFAAVLNVCHAAKALRPS